MGLGFRARPNLHRPDQRVLPSGRDTVIDLLAEAGMQIIFWPELSQRFFKGANIELTD